MKIKIRRNQCIFDTCFIGWVTYYMLFGLSMFEKLFPLFGMFKCFTIMMCAGCGLVLINSKLSKQEFFRVTILLLSALMVSYFTRSESAFVLFFVCCTAKSINYQETFDRLFKAMFWTCLFIMAFSLLGLIPNKISIGETFWENRFYLGFRHPNYSGAIFLNLILLKIVNTKANFKMSDYFFSIILEIINFIGPKSKTSLLLGIIAIASVFIYNNFNKKYVQQIISKGKYLPMIFIGISIFVVYGYSLNKAWAVAFNLFFSTRIDQMAYFWNNYNPTIFGQVLENVSSSQSNSLMQMRGLDNGYLYMLLGEGIIFTVEYIVVFFKSVKKFALEKKYYGIIVLILVLIQSLTEAFIFRIEINPILLLLSEGIYYKSTKKNEV